MTRLLLIIFLVLAPFAAQAQTEQGTGSAQQPSVEEAIAASHNPGQLLQVAGAATQRGDQVVATKALERLVAIRPYNQRYALQLAAFYAQSEELSKSFEQLVKLQEAGMAVNLDVIPGLDNLRQYPLYEYLLEKMQEAGEEHGSPSELVSLDDADFAPTGVAFHDGEYLLASLRTGEIVRISQSGETSSIVDAQQGRQLGAISDLAVTPDGESIWVSVNDIMQHVGHDPSNRRAPQLLRLSWSGEVLERFDVPQAGDTARLAGLAVASDGTVYVGDQGRAGVYSAKSGEDAMSIVGAAPRLTSIRALTLVENDSKLLLADYALGLFLLDLESGQPTVVRSSGKLNLGGIEYLNNQGQEIVAIQPGHLPARVLRLKMSDDFSIVQTGLVQARALPDMMYPMRGVFTDDAFVMVANSNVPLLRSGGEFAEGQRKAPKLIGLAKSVEFPRMPTPASTPAQPQQ